jgi:hypothetical protein
MPLWWVLSPLFLIGLVLWLAHLESVVVAPLDRGMRVAQLLESASPDELERQLAVMFAALTKRRTRDVRRLEQAALRSPSR